MKKLFVILCTLVVGALITLKVTSRKEETNMQTAPEAQTPNRRQPLRPRIAEAQPESSQETNAAETSLREKLEREGRYAAIFAKEAQWKEQFKELKKGMTLQEAVAVMGEPPTFLLAVTNTSGVGEMVPVSTNALQIVKRHAYVFYSPDGVPPKDFKTGELRPNRLPLDFFELQFDAAGRLYSMVDNYEDPRERLRRELSEDARGREMLAREAEWKEKSKLLKEGMTMQEVIGVMGEPTQREKISPEGEGFTLLYYAPNGSKDLFWSSGNKLDILTNLTLTFDSTEKLEKINSR